MVAYHRSLDDMGAASSRYRTLELAFHPASIPHVFDRFFRVDEARSRDDGGAGARIIQLSNRFVPCMALKSEVESRVEAGSCFRVTFPLPRRSVVATVMDAPRSPQFVRSIGSREPG